MNVCFRTEIAVVVVDHFFLQDINVFVAAVFRIPYFLPFIHCTDDLFFPGSGRDRSRQANNPHCSFLGASHNLTLGVLSGSMRPVRTAVLQTTG
jgi:hypothetical protein